MFSKVENDWIACFPSAKSVEAFKQHRALIDEGPQRNVVYKDDMRWAGHLLESALHCWLIEQHVGFGFGNMRHGGVDGKPDFELYGWGVGVKCRTALRGPMRPHYVVNVPDKHIQREIETAMVFGCYEHTPGRLLLLGAISRSRFLEEATFVDQGQAINPVTEADEAAWSIQAETLTPMEEFLATIRKQSTPQT